MKPTFKSLILIFYICIFPAIAEAQQVNTMYFMEDVPLRHLLNPAFQPTEYYYLSLPVVGLTQASVGNNSVTLKDIIYNYNGETVSFLHPTGGNIPNVINKLKPITDLRGNLQINLLSFGFKHKTGFWSFSLTEKVEAGIDVPKDFFLVSMLGTPQINNNYFDFSMLQTDVSAYSEAAFGYAKTINKKWSAGVKLKLLTGFGNVSNSNKLLKMEAGVEKWSIQGEGSANISSPYQVEIGNNFSSISSSYPTSVANLFKPSGTGVGCDVGVVFKPTDEMTISAAVIDFGFIRWKANAQNINYKIDYSFNGIGQIDSITGLNSFVPVINKFTTANSLVDSLLNAVKTNSTVSKTNNPYTTYTPTRINFGAEYSLPDYHLSFGILSSTIISKKILNEEITASINAKPVKWLNTSLSYSILGGQFSSIGAGIGVRTGFIHWFAAADFIAFQKSTLALKELNPQNWDIKIPIPYNSKNANFSLGVTFVLDQIIPENGLIMRKKRQDCNCDI